MRSSFRILGRPEAQILTKRELECPDPSNHRIVGTVLAPNLQKVGKVVRRTPLPSFFLGYQVP